MFSACRGDEGGRRKAGILPYSNKDSSDKSMVRKELDQIYGEKEKTLTLTSY